MILFSFRFVCPRKIKVSLFSISSFSGIIKKKKEIPGFLSFSSFMKFFPSSFLSRKILPRCYYYKNMMIKNLKNEQKNDQK